jgi:hypothetical protein
VKGLVISSEGVCVLQESRSCDGAIFFQTVHARPSSA